MQGKLTTTSTGKLTKKKKKKKKTCTTVCHRVSLLCWSSCWCCRLVSIDESWCIMHSFHQSWERQELKTEKNVERRKCWRVGSPRDVPTRHYLVVTMTLQKMAPSCPAAQLAHSSDLIDRSPVFVSLWTVSQSVLTRVTQVCGPAPSRMSANKPVVVLHYDILIAVAFYEDVLNKGSPFTERRACNKGRGV